MNKVRNLILFLFLFLNFGFQKQQQDIEFLVHEPGKKLTRAPLLVILHGYGANEEDLFDLAKTFDPRFKSYSLRAPYQLNEGGFAWFKLKRDTEKGLTYDYLQARESAVKVMQWILKTCREQNLDSNRIYLLGFSQGAMLSYDMAIANPTRIKGVLALSGKLMPESRQLLKKGTSLKTISVFIGHGNQDLLIPHREAQDAQNYLKMQGVQDLQLKLYTASHSLTGDEIIDIRKWLTAKLDQPVTPLKTKKGPD